MAKEIRADPRELVRLAGETLAAADRLGGHYRDEFDALHVPQRAFGDTAAGARAHHTAQWCLDVSGPALAGLVTVLESDVDRLHRTAFAYQKADRQADARIGHARGGRD